VSPPPMAARSGSAGIVPNLAFVPPSTQNTLLMLMMCKERRPVDTNRANTLLNLLTLSFKKACMRLHLDGCLPLWPDSCTQHAKSRLFPRQRLCTCVSRVSTHQYLFLQVSLHSSQARTWLVSLHSACWGTTHSVQPFPLWAGHQPAHWLTDWLAAWLDVWIDRMIE
jgi:hypothetical protein